MCGSKENPSRESFSKKDLIGSWRVLKVQQEILVDFCICARDPFEQKMLEMLAKKILWGNEAHQEGSTMCKRRWRTLIESASDLLLFLPPRDWNYILCNMRRVPPFRAPYTRPQRFHVRVCVVKGICKKKAMRGFMCKDSPSKQHVFVSMGSDDGAEFLRWNHHF